jgi:demethylmenaquinone methyltransferase/2-methoxy-6-polyprenyl-1,4-benzoquinol methylase
MPQDDFIDRALTRDEETIRDMFSHEAPHYDFLNHLLSFNLDKGWRKAAVRKSRFDEYGDNARVLDLCTGTGDVLFEFLNNPNFNGKCVGLDFAQPMIDLAKKKAQALKVSDRVDFVTGNVLDLQYDNNSFDIITISFGLRNLKDLSKGLEEIFRVLKPGGRFLSIEFFRPDNSLSLAISSWYVGYVIPFIGKLVSGRRGAYDYLPASRQKFVSADELNKLLESKGFRNVKHGHFLFRITTLHTAMK